MGLNKLFLGGLAILGGLVAFPAFAGSSDGFYGGITLGTGYDQSKMKTSTVFSPTGYFATSSVPAIGDVGKGTGYSEAYLVGLLGGYSVKQGDQMRAIEVDFSAFDTDTKREGTRAYPCCAPTSFTVKQELKTDWLSTVRGRFGYAASDKATVYGTLGVALTEMRMKATLTDTFASAYMSDAFSKLKTGWVFGAGVDYDLGSNMSLRAEYLHLDFGDISDHTNRFSAFTPAINFPSNTFTTKTDLTSDILRIGVTKAF